jgi:hypothetical protein
MRGVTAFNGQVGEDCSQSILSLCWYRTDISLIRCTRLYGVTYQEISSQLPPCESQISRPNIIFSFTLLNITVPAVTKQFATRIDESFCNWHLRTYNLIQGLLSLRRWRTFSTPSVKLLHMVPQEEWSIF